MAVFHYLPGGRLFFIRSRDGLGFDLEAYRVEVQKQPTVSAYVLVLCRTFVRGSVDLMGCKVDVPPLTVVVSGSVCQVAGIGIEVSS